MIRRPRFRLPDVPRVAMIVGDRIERVLIGASLLGFTYMVARVLQAWWEGRL